MQDFSHLYVFSVCVRDLVWSPRPHMGRGPDFVVTGRWGGMWWPPPPPRHRCPLSLHSGTLNQPAPSPLSFGFPQAFGVPPRQCWRECHRVTSFCKSGETCTSNEKVNRTEQSGRREPNPQPAPRHHGPPPHSLHLPHVGRDIRSSLGVVPVLWRLLVSVGDWAGRATRVHLL